jgi:hypothetical protein
MPAIVLSRAAAARARKPIDFCELVEGVLRWWVRRLAEVTDDGDEIEVVLVWVGDSGPSEEGEGKGDVGGASEGSRAEGEGEGDDDDDSELLGAAETASWVGRDDCVDCETAAI